MRALLERIKEWIVDRLIGKKWELYHSTSTIYKLDLFAEQYGYTVRNIRTVNDNHNNIMFEVSDNRETETILQTLCLDFDKDNNQDIAIIKAFKGLNKTTDTNDED